MSRTHAHAPRWVRVRRSPDARFEHFRCDLAAPHEGPRWGWSRGRRINVTETLPPRLEYVERIYGALEVAPAGYPVKRGPGWSVTVTIPVVKGPTEVTTRAWVPDPTPVACDRWCDWTSDAIDARPSYVRGAAHRADVRQRQGRVRREGREYGRAVATEYNAHGEVGIDDPDTRTPGVYWW